MIDEIIADYTLGLVLDEEKAKQRGKSQEWENAQYEMHLANALTAIYEIGLECIGADEKEQVPLSKLEETVFIGRKIARDARNEVRASQRKAWAKACGVAEK